MNINDFFININNLNNNKTKIYPKNDYELLSTNNNQNIFYLIVIFIGIIYILIYNKFDVKYLFYLFFTYFVIKFILEYHYTIDINNKNNNNNKKDFITKILFNNEYFKEYIFDDKINNTKNISYFNNNYNLIDFLWNIREYLNYSKKNYKEILISSNLLLKYYYSIINDSEDINKNYNIFNKYFKETMNNFQSLIYSIPTNINNNYLFNSYMKELYNILELYKKQVEIKKKDSKINTNLNINSVPYQNELVYPSNEFKNNKFDLF